MLEHVLYIPVIKVYKYLGRENMATDRRRKTNYNISVTADMSKWLDGKLILKAGCGFIMVYRRKIALKCGACG